MLVLNPFLFLFQLDLQEECKPYIDDASALECNNYDDNYDECLSPPDPVRKTSQKIPLDDESDNAKRNPLDNESGNAKRNPLNEDSDNENNIASDNDYTPSSPSADSNDSDNDEPSDENETTQGKRGGTRGHGGGSMELGRG